MGKKYFVVHFSGHGDLKLQGTRDHKAFRDLASLLECGDVSRFCFYAGLGVDASKRVARGVLGIIRGWAGKTDDVTFIIHGFSAGGVTALHFARWIPDHQIAYIALSDAAFMRDESDDLMLDPGSRAYYLNENYYQRYDQSSRSREIHGPISASGWKNIPVLLPLVLNPHAAAVAAADRDIFETMKQIVKDGR